MSRSGTPRGANAYRYTLTRRTGYTSSGLRLVPVKASTLVRQDANHSRWDLVLECGHELKNHRKANSIDQPPKWAGCRECTEKHP